MAKKRCYPSSAQGYKLHEEVGSGAFGHVYRASVLRSTWDGFLAEAKKNGVSQQTLKTMIDAGIKDNPGKLIDFDLNELATKLGSKSEAVKVSESVKSSQIACEDVAIKIMEGDSIDWDDVRREITTMRSTSHENIVKVHRAFLNCAEGDQELWIVMPFVKAGSCHNILRKAFPEGIKDPKTVATVLCKVLKALAYLHGDQKVHRDIKAGNILVAEDGEVKLADFGTAATSQYGGCTTFKGSYYWMAPEVIRQKAPYNSKADIWSFGITAMELAYGSAPYQTERPLKAMVMILQHPSPKCAGYPHFKKGEFPRSFHNMIAACLSKDPKQRPSAKKLLSHAFITRNAQDKVYLAQNLVQGFISTQKRTSHVRNCRRTDRKVRSRSVCIPVESFVLDGGMDDHASAVGVKQLPRDSEIPLGCPMEVKTSTPGPEHDAAPVVMKDAAAIVKGRFTILKKKTGPKSEIDNHISKKGRFTIYGASQTRKR